MLVGVASFSVLTGVPTRTAYAAAKHAAEQGWIETSSLHAVQEEKRADEGVSGEKADVPGVPEEPKAPTVVVE